MTEEDTLVPDMRHFYQVSAYGVQLREGYHLYVGLLDTTASKTYAAKAKMLEPVSKEAMILMDAVDQLQVLVNMQRQHPKRIEPYPRPWSPTEIRKRDERVAKAKAKAARPKLQAHRPHIATTKKNPDEVAAANRAYLEKQQEG